MIIYSRSEAKELVDRNCEIAEHSSMVVVTVFHTDLVTKEVCVTDMFSHDVVQAMIWKSDYLNRLKSLKVPYVAYIGNTFESAYDYVEFEEDK